MGRLGIILLVFCIWAVYCGTALGCLMLFGDDASGLMLPHFPNID